MSDDVAAPARFDAVVVGAGFAGLYLLHKLRDQLGLKVRAIEAGDGVGGTWYWNRYPGARCDIESLDYSYGFSDELQQDWVWTERYPSQPEILRYLNHVADRFDLRPDITLATRVTAATFDEDSATWTVETTGAERDSSTSLTARFVVMATGCLSDAKAPGIAGLDDFAGRLLHTARWPEDAPDFTGQRVGVIGTGSSGIQVIPVLAQQAEELYVFQRTPAYSLPAHNRPLSAAEQDKIKANYPEYREQSRWSLTGVLPLPSEVSHRPALEVDPQARRAEYQRRWDHGGNAITGAFRDLLGSLEANATVSEFVREKIAALVHDPETAARLTPHYPYGAKRPCIDTGYFATYNRDNVRLVDLRAEPLTTVTPSGVRTLRDGEATDYPLDVLVLATGFDAFTGSLSKIRITGPGGVTLASRWADGPQAFLGLAVAGLPNLFLITGPGSPAVLSNMVLSIEQHVEWIARLIEHVRAAGHTHVEVTREAEQAWTEHAAELAAATVYDSADSWYIGANVPGKPRVLLPYVGGVKAFRKRCEAVADGGYRGFAFGATGTVT
jgi:cyclohexanone monooxygenase